MYIKQITICGFKSYKDKIVIDEFFDGLNVIVGRNGSGKSNVFAAIEFALTLEYRYMKPEARSSLLFQQRVGVDPAYVEVVFDNTNRKLPINEATVTFRRVLASKKDKFFVNGKEIMNAKQFLDVAGFTNPYFIVKQGKINDLALATDAVRFKIISEVLGMKSYDDKISDCKRHLEAGDSKQNAAKAMMDKLQERLKTLENEVKEQKRYMKADQAKRAIEYVLHEKELQYIQRMLDECETRRAESNLKLVPSRDKLDRVSRDKQIKKRDTEDLKQKAKQFQELRGQYEESRNRIAADLECRKQELNDLVTSTRINASMRQNMPELENDIATAKHQLGSIEKELEGLKEPIEKLRRERCRYDMRIKEISEKQHRKSVYKTPAEYRKHVQKKLKEIDERGKGITDSLNSSRISLSETEKSFRQESEKLKSLQENISIFGDEIIEINRTVDASRLHLVTAKNSLEMKWRELSETEQNLAQQKERTARLDEECRKCYGFPIFQGRKGVKQIIEDFKARNAYSDVVKGYFGLVCENIHCNSGLDLAIEAAGGRKLVNHIVESEAVAQVILKEFNARKLRGEVNFIPRSGLKGFSSRVPEDYDSRCAKPLMSVIECNEKFSAVVNSVFGNSMLCDSLETATDTMRKYKVQCVTLDGEKVSTAGTMSGGSRRPGPQKLELQRAKCIDEKKLCELVAAKQKLQSEANKLNTEYKTAKQNHEQLSVQKASVEAKKRNAVSELQMTEKRILALKQQVQNIERTISDSTTNLAALDERKRMLKADLNNEDSSDNVDAVKQFRSIVSKYDEAVKEQSAKLKAKCEVEAKLQILQKTYYKNIGSVGEHDERAKEQEIACLESIIGTLSQQIAGMQSKIHTAHRDLLSVEKMIVQTGKQLDALMEEEQKLKDELQTYLTDLDSLTAAHLKWQTKLGEKKLAYAKLGIIPLNMEKYEDLREKELLHRLKKVNMDLKNKVEINHKAVQQYEELVDKCRSFEDRIKSYETERRNIECLLEDLETRKGEAMLENIRLLQEQFKSIFCSVVPDGNAELVLYGNRAFIDHDMDIHSDELREQVGQSQFDGVRVKVNFRGQQLQNMGDLAQLSGGQKSIVALSLILAIQSIDPVPFYLFDEVDQALDAAYRSSVAKVIANMSERSQFICTTFRKEFVLVADKIFGVSYQNKCSHIQPVSETQALDFVENAVEPSTPSLDGSYTQNDSTA